VARGSSKPDAIARSSRCVRAIACCAITLRRTARFIRLPKWRDPYPDPHDRKEKNLVADLRALRNCRAGDACGDARQFARCKVKFLKMYA